MSTPALRKTEHRLVELKAKVDDLNLVRKKLIHLKAQHVGTFRQTDIYFEVPKGRLKLREVEGYNEAELVYYERENIAGPKRSDVFILKVPKPALFKALLGKALKVRATVDKTREIYQYRGKVISEDIKIHLDTVENLGTFVEFEVETSADPTSIKKSCEALESLMGRLGIERKNLEGLSYVDLLTRSAFT